MKIHKVATNNKDALLFSVKETTNFSTEEDWTSITLPSGVLKGNGKRKFLLSLSILSFLAFGGLSFPYHDKGGGQGVFYYRKVPV